MGKDCTFIRHEEVSHVKFCKEHDSIVCEKCHSSVTMDPAEYWKERGVKMFLERHHDCDARPVRTIMAETLSEIIDQMFIDLGCTLIGEIDNRMVLCILHESEPAFIGRIADAEIDQFISRIGTINEASEFLELREQEIAQMNENCPYVILAMDGMRYIRELGWGEVAQVWQKSIDAMAQEMAKIRTNVN